MNTDLISRSALLAELNDDKYTWEDYDAVESAMRNIPSVDAVIPVRCKDCKHGKKSNTAFAVDTAKPLCECPFMSYPHQWHEYCSYGERRGGENND